MMRFIRIVSAISALGISFLMAPDARADQCPYDAQSIVAGEGEALVCSCPANDSNGAVYGTGRYTRDSKICTAARHAGAMTPAGGDVQVYLGGACDDFKSSSQNGVNSSAWSAYPGTFAFSFPLPACGLSSTMAPPADGSTWCPENATGIAATPPEGMTCACAAGVNLGGAIYGSNRYTDDSKLCTAAVHAGVLDAAQGGNITFFLGEGCAGFEGTVANGVISNAWGAYPRSFGFAASLPACAAASPPPVVGSTTPTAPTTDAPPAPGANDGPEQWQARADLYASVLPEPLAGWDATPRTGMWENSAMTSRHVSGMRTFKHGNTLQADIFVAIFNAPDGTPHESTEQMWTDEAYRTSRTAVLGEVAGRPTLIQTEGGNERIIFRMTSGLFVEVSRLGTHSTTRADIDAYIALLDFAKIEALPMR